MPTVITVEQQSPTNSSSRSNSFTDESSTGTGVHVSPTSGSQEDSDLLDDQSWDPIYSDEIEPSESASRPRPKHYRRSGSRQPPVHQGPIRRHTTTERTTHRPPVSRVHRHPAPNPPSSVDPQEDYPGYGRGYLPPHGAYGGRAPPPGYAQSSFSYSPNPFGTNAGQIMPYGGPAAYPYPQNPFSPAPAVGGQGYFGPQPHGPAHGAPGYDSHEIMPYGQAPGYGYGGYAIRSPAPQSQYYPFVPPTSPPEVPPAVESEAEKKLKALEAQLEQTKLEAEKVRRAEEEKKLEAERAKQAEEEKKLKRLEAQLEKAKLEAEMAKLEADKAKRADEEKKAEAEKAKKADEEKKLANLQRLLEETKADAAKAKKLVEERAAADKKAADEAALKADTDKKIKEEVSKVKEEADKKTKAAEEAKTKAEEEKKAADEAKAKAEADAKALLAPKDEKKKPIKFKDAVGRKFSFPFHLCNTWKGMENLIRQAFMHVDVIGPHVADGHYDLVGPNGEIILPQVWETMIEPDWAVTMHMWPMPEQQRGPPDGVHVVDAGPGHRPTSGGRRRERADRPPAQHGGRRGPPPPPPPGWIGPPPGVPGPPPADEVIEIIDMSSTKPSKKKPKDSGGIMGGFFGGNSKSSKSSGKGPKKAEQYGTCRVM